jgi:hypothetical protein
MIKKKFFIINGGEIENLWEVVVRARSAKDALTRYAASLEADNEARWARFMKDKNEKHLPAPSRGTEEVGVSTASVDKFGVIHRGKQVIEKARV